MKREPLGKKCDETSDFGDEIWFVGLASTKMFTNYDRLAATSWILATMAHITVMMYASIAGAKAGLCKASSSMMTASSMKPYILAFIRFFFTRSSERG